MTDVHKLPLVGHDLPEAGRPRKMRVCKERPGWIWEHYCASGRIYQAGAYHAAWSAAFKDACDHLKECL